MTRLAVDPEALEQLVAELAACENRLAAARAQVDTAVAALQGSWVGLAAAEQAQVQRRWNRGEHEMRAALRRLREIATTAAGNYQAAAAANRDLWTR